MPLRLKVFPTRLATQAWMLVLVMAALVTVLLLRSLSGPGLPTIRSLGMPVPTGALDRTLTIGPRPGVTAGDRTRLAVDRYGQFRGHWWWNRGWVYVSGKLLPGARIRVRIDTRSLAITDLPPVNAVAGVRRYGSRVVIGDYIQLDVVRFGIGAELLATRTAGGPFPGRHVVDQLQGRAWSSRGLTITRVQVAASPANHVPCALLPSTSGWGTGCRLLGQRPLVSDRRGHFPSNQDAMVEADTISLTATPTNLTPLPIDSMRVRW